MTAVGDLQSIGTFGWFVTAGSGDTTPPVPPPEGLITVNGSTVSVELTNAGEAMSTRELQRRANMTSDAWVVVDSTTTLTVGEILQDTSVPNGVYEYQLVDKDSNGNETRRGHRWCGVCIRTTTWDLVMAATRAKLEAQGILPTNIHDGRQPPPNYDEEIYTLRQGGRTEEARANNLVLRGYQVGIEFRRTNADDTGDEQMDAVEVAETLLVTCFDNKTPADFPSLPDLELSRLETVSFDDRPATTEDDLEDEVVARFQVTFPIWETP